MGEKYAAAFNAWMDDFVNNPEQFQNATKEALDHMRERLEGKPPSYGDTAAAAFESYLASI